MCEGLGGTLRAFGLDDAAATVYLAVLDAGETRAGAVVRRTDLSRRRVYEVLADLEDRGLLVVHDDHSPTTVESAPAEAVLDALRAELAERRERLHSLEEAADRIAGQIDDRRDDPETGARPIELLTAREAVLDRIGEDVGRAREEVLCTVPYDRLPAVADHLRDAVSRGLLVQVLLTDRAPDDVAPEAVTGLGTVVRAQEAWAPTHVVVDTDERVVAPTPGVLGGEEGYAAAITDWRLVQVHWEAFHSAYWARRSRQVHVCDPVALPETFERFQLAVLHAALHDAAGRSLRARVEARPTDGRERVRTLEGPVTDVRNRAVEPLTHEFPGENAIDVRTDEGVVSVGGHDNWHEDVVGLAVELRPA